MFLGGVEIGQFAHLGFFPKYLFQSPFFQPANKRFRGQHAADKGGKKRRKQRE
jgi:hypothetical protein